MLDSLQLIYNRLINEVTTTHYRFLYHTFNLNGRLVGLIGPRGVGKTTLILQYIKNHFADINQAFYFSADHIYFKSNTLYEFIEKLYLEQNRKYFFIDEIHKYPDWNQELKNLYDGFPSITLVFSGSSSLDLVKGAYDLSRRAKMYHLPGLSFREYLNFNHNTQLEPFTFEELTKDYQTISAKLANTEGILGDFRRYLQQGYYPFFADDPLSYYERLLNIIDKTIYGDISNFYNLRTGSLGNLGKILNYLASIPPGKVSSYNIGKNLGIDDKTAANYLQILHETGLTTMVYPAETGNQGLRKPEKVFLSNTNLQYAIGGNLSKQPEIGTIRELAFIQSTQNAGLNIFHSKIGDYQINDMIYEIGGKNKTNTQIKGTKNAYLVKDDILMASKGSIPLMLFGFLY